MFAITLTEKGGDQRRLDFDKTEIKIGRVQGNDVVLPKGNVSKQHARIVLKDGKFIIVDLKSTNGTYVNGRKITSPLVVKDSDKIYIGDFILGIIDEGAAAPAPAPAARPMTAPTTPPRVSAPTAPPPMSAPMSAPMAPPPMSAPMAPPPMAAPMAPPPMAAPSAPPPMAPPPMAPSPMASPSAPPPMAAPSAPPPMGAPFSVPPAPSAPPPMAAAPSPMSAPPPTAPPPMAALSAPPPSAAPVGSPPAPLAPATAAPLASPRPVSKPSEPPPLANPVSPLASSPLPPTTTKPASAKPRLVGAGAGPTKRPTVGDKRFVAIPELNENAKTLLRLQDSILYQLVPQLRLDEVALEQLGEEELWQRAESTIVDLVEGLEADGGIPKNVDQDQLIKETLNEALGLGPLEDLLADDTIEEVVVEGVDRILTTKSGTISGAGVGFSSERVFRRVLQRLVAPAGVTIDVNTSFVDVRLADGSKLSAALGPVAARGPCLSLRKPTGGSADLRTLQTRDVLSAGMGSFLSLCVASRKNIVVCGAPNSGKETVLAALASEVAAGERLITVEEVSHMNLSRERWTALECRAGTGAVPDIGLDDLIAGALRMNPDRLVVADLKGGEAFRLVQSMNASCDGTISSISGEGSLEALTRYSQLASIGASGHLNAVREMVASAIDLVVHVVRYGDGKIRIATIDEVAATTERGFSTIFSFDGDTHKASGVTPAFLAELQERGFKTDDSIFR